VTLFLAANMVVVVPAEEAAVIAISRRSTSRRRAEESNIALCWMMPSAAADTSTHPARIPVDQLFGFIILRTKPIPRRI
jgi:hypothetical protein